MLSARLLLQLLDLVLGVRDLAEHASALGESKLEEQLQKAVTRANKTKQLDADSKDLKKKIDEAEKAEAS
ncbi:MAG: hypothetical protein WBB30_02405 [Solirubrobacterales bacterium]